jgi:hypothetical protein
MMATSIVSMLSALFIKIPKDKNVYLKEDTNPHESTNSRD